MNLACWFWRTRMLNLFSVFPLFCYYLLLEKGYPLRSKNVKFPTPKDDLWQVWLKLAKWFLEKKILK
jgi:hypothetical protein